MRRTDVEVEQLPGSEHTSRTGTGAETLSGSQYANRTDTRSPLEKAEDAVTGNRVDDKTGRPAP